jgi:rhodanese-related sulfurtransferase
MTRILKQALLIVLAAAAVGLLVNLRFLAQYQRGEFAHGFVAAAETESLVFLGASQAFDLWQNRAATFIDARSPGLFAEGHVPFAINIPEGAPDKDRLAAAARLDPRLPAVVYCSGGTCVDSIHVARWLLSRKVVGDVRVFQGGWQEWVDLGFPIEASHDAK